ncbi:MAG: carbohydrate porin [Candidatus Accumulibacter sp. UW26]|jgi:porin
MNAMTPTNGFDNNDKHLGDRMIAMNKHRSLLTALLLSLAGPLLTAAAAMAEEPAVLHEGVGAREMAPSQTAADTPDWQASTLGGDWGGARKRLYDAGVEAELVYTADFLRNNTGGLQRGSAYMGHVDLILQLDGEKLFGWTGGSGYLQLIDNSGGRFNLNEVGSLMGVGNLEAPVNRSGVFQAWLQQSFLDDQASLRVGLYPLDSEFYVADAAGVFVHPSFGMAAEVASFGSLAGPSIYATSSYGARLRVDPDPAWYAMLALTQGVDSERAPTAGPHLHWSDGRGSMLIGEVGFSPLKARLSGEPAASAGKDDYEPISKLALGIWRFSPQFPELVNVDASGEPQSATHWGAYVIAEQTLYRVPETNRDLAAFVRYGFTDGTTTTLDYSLSIGFSYRGPFAGRENDTFGIAATRAHAGPQGRALLSDELGMPLSSSAETALEITYRMQLAPGVVVQPVIQRIFHPGLYLPHATVAGARLQLAL